MATATGTEKGSPTQAAENGHHEDTCMSDSRRALGAKRLNTGRSLQELRLKVLSLTVLIGGTVTEESRRLSWRTSVVL